MIEQITSIAVAGIVSLVATLFGARTIDKLQLAKTNQTERLVFSIGIGFALLLFAALVINSLNLTSQLTWLVLLIVMAIFARKEVNAFAQLIKNTWLEAKKTTAENEFIENATLGLITLIVLVSFLVALSPPASGRPGPIDWDSLNYHLLIPKAYLQAGGMFYWPQLAYANLPHALENFYTIPMAFASETSARLIALFLNSTLLITIYALTRKFTEQKFALLASALFLSVPAFAFAMPTAQVDLPLALFTTLALLTAVNFKQTKRTEYLLITGILAGTAASIKLPGVIPGLLLGIWIGFELIKSKFQLMKKITLFTQFALPAAIIAAPWYIRNWINNGNPIWPFYYTVLQYFGISGNDSAILIFNNYWHKLAVAAGSGHSPLDFALLPINLTFKSGNFNGIMSFAFLALLPLAAYYLWKVQKADAKTANIMNTITIGVLLLTAIWFVTYQELRFLAPVLAAIAVLCAVSIAFSSTASNRSMQKTSTIAGKVILIALLISACASLYYSYNAIPVAIGLETRENYLLRTTDTYYPCTVANQAKHSKVLFFTSDRGYYCNGAVVYTYYYQVKGKTIPEVIANLKQDGFTYVIANPVKPIDEEREQIVKDALATLPKETRQGSLTLYRIV